MFGLAVVEVQLRCFIAATDTMCWKTLSLSCAVDVVLALVAFNVLSEVVCIGSIFTYSGSTGSIPGMLSIDAYCESLDTLACFSNC